MYGKELNERNPLRLFEHSIHGGLGRGNIGVVVARHGTGKTAFLVGIALDDAMRGRKVLHVSLDNPVDHLREFYDEIFMDLAHAAHLEDLQTERLEMERNRMIHTYAGKSFTIHKLRHSIKFLKEYAHFEPECVILEGFDFERASLEDMEAFRQLATEYNVEFWMSAVTHRGVPLDGRGIPEPVSKVAATIAVIVQMTDDHGGVHLSLLKDHDNPNVAKLTLALDPSTMLLVSSTT
ncbi:MAG TPA: ATPase domain-containing protein [Terriglobia bacterium]|nr:ATPase domain-containing protein [Terriglobia bacterium]